MSNRGTPTNNSGDDHSGGGSVADAFALLDRALDALAGAPWWTCRDADLPTHIQALAVAESRVAAAQVAAVAEGISRGLSEQAGAKTGGQWLRGLLPYTPHAAAQRATLAVDLPSPGLDPTRAALTAGQISVAHAAVVTRTMAELDRLPDIDPQTWADAQTLLVEEATRLDPAQLARAALALRNRLDPDAPDRLARDEDAQEARQLLLVQERTGMWLLRGLLPPLAGATLQAALDPLGAPRPGTDGTPDKRTATQRRADALTLLAEAALTARGDQPNRLPERHGSPVRVTITADLDTVLADLTYPADPAGAASRGSRAGGRGLEPARLLTDDGPWELSPLALQVAACDAEVVPVLLDGFGRALDVGESQYRFPKRIRHAVELRDKHCTFPNCQAPPAWCHTHHITPYGRGGRPGGPTAEHNGTLLCGRHHRFIHAHAWTARLRDGVVHWTPPRASQQLARDSGPGIGPDPGHPDERHTAYQRELTAKLRDLARQWLSRNPALKPQPNNTS